MKKRKTSQCGNVEKKNFTMWKCRKEKVKISGEPGPGYVVCNKDQSVSQKGR